MNTAFFERHAEAAAWPPEVPTHNTSTRRQFSRCDAKDDLAYLDLRMASIASTKPARAFWATATTPRPDQHDVRSVLRRMDLEMPY